MARDRSHLRIFTEIGFGNRSFISTEIEYGQREKRVCGFVRFRVTGVYLRIWIGYKVYILSTRGGFETTLKSKRKFKCLIGFSGMP
jgi:hypothetical protein